MWMAGVEDERLPAIERVVEDARETGVPAFCQARRMACRGLFLSVVIDVEMLGLENAEIEAVVADLVPAEILRLG